MKKVLLISVAFLLFFSFTACQNVVSPESSSNVTPDTPEAVVIPETTGSLTLTVEVPANSRALLNGIAQDGSSFTEEVTTDVDRTWVVFKEELNLINWNFSVKIFEKSADDYDPAVDDDPLAIAVDYATILLLAGVDNEIVFGDMITKASILSDFINPLFDLYGMPQDISEADFGDPLLSPDDGGIISAFLLRETCAFFLLYAMTYDDYILYSLLDEELEPSSALVELGFGIMEDLIADMTFLIAEGKITMGTGSMPDTDLLYSLFQDSHSLFDDFTFVIFNYIDLTVEGIAEGDTLGDDLELSVRSDEFTFGDRWTYSWILNGVEVGTGIEYTLSSDDCVSGDNYIMAAISYGGVIFGYERIEFFVDDEDLLTVGSLALLYPELGGYIMNNLGYLSDMNVEDITGTFHIDSVSISLVGIHELVNITHLWLTGMGIDSVDDVTPIYGLDQLQQFLLIESPAVSQDIRDVIESNLPNCNDFIYE